MGNSIVVNGGKRCEGEDETKLEMHAFALCESPADHCAWSCQAFVSGARISAATVSSRDLISNFEPLPFADLAYMYLPKRFTVDMTKG